MSGYAIYFDHRRRTDPEFRKALRKDAKREARQARVQQEESANAQRNAIRRAVDNAKAEGFPTDVQEKEEYFMQQVGQGEMVSQQREFQAYPGSASR